MNVFSILSFLLLAFVASCVAQQLPQGVSQIFSVDANYPNNSDLKKFDKDAKRAQIFAIGEDAHGNANYQNFQFRLSKYLISHHGYKRILMEVISDDKTLNNYLTTGQGNIRMILYNNPWQGDSIQMVNFFTWVRQYNVGKKEKDMVLVHAVDPQKPWMDSPIIQDFVEAYDAKYNQTYNSTFFSNIYNDCFGATFANQIDWAFSAESSAYSTCGCLPDNETVSCVSSVNFLEDTIRSEQKILTKWLGETYIQDVLHALASIRAWQTKSSYLYTKSREAIRFREAVFSLNTLYYSKRENNKKSGSIFLAHNLHIAKKALLPPFSNVASDIFLNVRTVGTVLSERLGDKYVSVAQSGYNVSVMFRGPAYALPTSPLSIDFTLQALNKSLLLLDTGANWVKQQGVWYVHEESIRNGRAYDLPLSFDHLVFHSVAPAAVFLNLPPTPTSSSLSSSSSISYSSSIDSAPIHARKSIIRSNVADSE